jgi:hypothetical protein
MGSLFEKMGGRKFVLTLIVIAVATAVQLAANAVITRGTQTSTETEEQPASAAPQAAPAGPSPEVIAAIQELAGKVQGIEQSVQTTTQILEVQAKRVAALSQMRTPQ